MAVTREKGSETRPCPTCDAPLAVVSLADGATSTVRCDKCYPTDLVEMASANPGRTQGTEIPQEDDK